MSRTRQSDTDAIAALQASTTALLASPQTVIESDWVTITDAQIKGKTPVEVVAAQGDGKIICPTAAITFFSGSVAYTNRNASAALAVWWDDNGLEAGSVAFPAGAGGAGTVYRLDLESGSRAGGWYDLVSDLANKNLAFASFNSSSGNLTGGDAANVWKVKVLYSVLDLSSFL